MPRRSRQDLIEDIEKNWDMPVNTALKTMGFCRENHNSTDCGYGILGGVAELSVLTYGDNGKAMHQVMRAQRIRITDTLGPRAEKFVFPTTTAEDVRDAVKSVRKDTVSADDKGKSVSTEQGNLLDGEEGNITESGTSSNDDGIVSEQGIPPSDNGPAKEDSTSPDSDDHSTPHLKRASSPKNGSNNSSKRAKTDRSREGAEAVLSQQDPPSMPSHTNFPPPSATATLHHPTVQTPIHNSHDNYSLHATPQHRMNLSEDQGADHASPQKVAQLKQQLADAQRNLMEKDADIQKLKEDLATTTEGRNRAMEVRQSDKKTSCHLEKALATAYAQFSEQLMIVSRDFLIENYDLKNDLKEQEKLSEIYKRTWEITNEEKWAQHAMNINLVEKLWKAAGRKPTRREQQAAAEYLDEKIATSKLKAKVFSQGNAENVLVEIYRYARKANDRTVQVISDAVKYVEHTKRPVMIENVVPEDLQREVAELFKNPAPGVL